MILSPAYGPEFELGTLAFLQRVGSDPINSGNRIPAFSRHPHYAPTGCKLCRANQAALSPGESPAGRVGRVGRV